MEIKVEKKVDDAFKNQVEAEKKDGATQEEAKPRDLKDILKETVEGKWTREYNVYPHQQVIILTYDPMLRTCGIKHVQNVISKTDVLNILRDSVHQLESMETIARTVQSIERVVGEQIALAVAQLSGGKRT